MSPKPSKDGKLTPKPKPKAKEKLMRADGITVKAQGKAPYGHGVIEERNGQWRAVIHVNQYGEKRRRKTSTFNTKTEATLWLKKIAGLRATGEIVAPKTLTVAAYLTAWVEGPDVMNPRLRGATQNQYSQVVRNYLIPTFGPTRLDALTTRAVTAGWLALSKPGATTQAKPGRPLLGATLSAHTVALARRTFRKALNDAVRNEQLKFNPVSLSELPYPKGTIKGKPEPISAEDLAKILAVVDEHRIGPLVKFALATGARLGELLALRIEDVTDKGVFIGRNLGRMFEGHHQIVNYTKTGVSRNVALGESALEAIRAEAVYRDKERAHVASGWDDQGLLFSSPIGTPRNMRNTQREWAVLLEKAGVTHCRFHTIRHSSATYLLQGGLDMESVSKVLGHSTSAITASAYAEVSEQMKAPSAAILDEAFNKAKLLR
jgi:integrase